MPGLRGPGGAGGAGEEAAGGAPFRARAARGRVPAQSSLSSGRSSSSGGAGSTSAAASAAEAAGGGHGTHGGAESSAGMPRRGEAEDGGGPRLHGPLVSSPSSSSRYGEVPVSRLGGDGAAGRIVTAALAFGAPGGDGAAGARSGGEADGAAGGRPARARPPAQIHAPWEMAEADDGGGGMVQPGGAGTSSSGAPAGAPASSSALASSLGGDGGAGSRLVTPGRMSAPAPPSEEVESPVSPTNGLAGEVASSQTPSAVSPTSEGGRHPEHLETVHDTAAQPPRSEQTEEPAELQRTPAAAAVLSLAEAESGTPPEVEDEEYEDDFIEMLEETPAQPSSPSALAARHGSAATSSGLSSGTGSRELHALGAGPEGAAPASADLMDNESHEALTFPAPWPRGTESGGGSSSSGGWHESGGGDRPPQLDEVVASMVSGSFVSALPAVEAGLAVASDFSDADDDSDDVLALLEAERPRQASKPTPRCLADALSPLVSSASLGLTAGVKRSALQQFGEDSSDEEWAPNRTRGTASATAPAVSGGTDAVPHNSTLSSSRGVASVVHRSFTESDSEEAEE